MLEILQEALTGKEYKKILNCIREVDSNFTIEIENLLLEIIKTGIENINVGTSFPSSMSCEDMIKSFSISVLIGHKRPMLDVVIPKVMKFHWHFMKINIIHKYFLMVKL